MAQSAPRYDPRTLQAVAVLDERAIPIAEVCRRVNALHDELSLPRASYVHLRRLVHAHRLEEDERRERRRELLRIAGEVYYDTTVGFLVDAYEVAERVREAGRRRS